MVLHPAGDSGDLENVVSSVIEFHCFDDFCTVFEVIVSRTGAWRRLNAVCFEISRVDWPVSLCRKLDVIALSVRPVDVVDEFQCAVTGFIIEGCGCRDVLNR